jgi:hypothetical protein
MADRLENWGEASLMWAATSDSQPPRMWAGAIMKFDFDPSQSPGVVKMLAVMKAFRESKREPTIPAISMIVRQALTTDELAGLPPAPEVPGEGKMSDDLVIAWSAFLLWAALRGEL